MTVKKLWPNRKKAITIVANDPEALKGTLKRVGGSQSDHWNSVLSYQTVQTLWLAHSDEETGSHQYSATIAASKHQRCRTAAAGCTAARPREHRREIRTPSDMGTTRQRRLQGGKRSQLCYVS
jgi:hypothetical protein